MQLNIVCLIAKNLGEVLKGSSRISASKSHETVPFNTYLARKTDLIYFDVTSKENADFKNLRSSHAES
jgi:hypothetical protein